MALESCRDVNGSTVPRRDDSIDELVDIGDAVVFSDELGVDFLDDFDLYVEDIKDRLTISRMVSDSVIRGMVNAVEQEAADRIAQKELELFRLKKMVSPCDVGSNKNETLRSLMKHYEPNIGVFSRLSDSLLEHDKILESFGSLKNAAKGQFRNLMIEIDQIKEHGSNRKLNSVSAVGLDGSLQEDEPRKWINIDRTLDSFLDSVYEQVGDIVYSSKASLSQWQLEREYQEEVERMVITTFIRSLKDQLEERLWDQNAQWYGNGNVNWIQKINGISSLREELDAISKSLHNPETGILNSHGSMEIISDLSNNKWIDHLPQKGSGSHVLSSDSLWEGNGKHGESVITEPENLDGAQLTHMSKEELVSFFKLEMTRMKRNHDYKLQDMTEKYFSLKRDLLKERGSSLPSRKDKEFDVLRKKIPDFIVKLDRILVENENFPLSSNNNENLLKERLESLLSENHQLRESLANKEKEVNCLSKQVSDSIEKMSQYSLTKENLLKRVKNLESVVEDAHIEATISGDVYSCFIREATSQIKWISEDSEMQHNIMKEIYDVILKDASCKMSHAGKSEFKDSDLESLIVEGLCTIIFREAFTEAKQKLHDLSLDAFEKERVLEQEVAEKKKLQQQVLIIASVVDEKEKLLNEAEAAMAREKEEFMVASKELDVLRDQTNQQKMILCKCNEESTVLKINLHQALEKLEKQKEEICEAENEYRKQMESVSILVEGLSKAVAGFECRVAEDMKRSNLRYFFYCYLLLFSFFHFPVGKSSFKGCSEKSNGMLIGFITLFML